MRIFIQIWLLAVLMGTFGPAFNQVYAPDFTMTDTDGNTYNLYTECDQGKVIILDFFYRNCPSCQVNTPVLDSIWQSYGASGDSVWVWGIEGVLNGPPGATNTEIEAFKNTYGATFPCFSTSYNNDSVLNLYGIYANPRYFVVCPDRKIKPCIVDDIGLYTDVCMMVLDQENVSVQKRGGHKIYQKDKKIVVDLEGVLSKRIVFELYSTCGRQLYSGKINLNGGKAEIEFACPGNGIYFTRIYSADKIIDQRKIMIL